MPEIIEKKFETGSLTLNYAEGPDNGPPLVLIPPQGADWTTYEKVFPLLSDAYHVFAIDIRGHGKSDWTTGNYTFSYIGDDMVRFLEDVASKKAIVSGNSSGGLIALWLAANRSDLISAAILEDPPLFSADWPRIRDDSYVYYVLQTTVELSRELHESKSVQNLARLFKKVRRPVKGGRLTGIPTIAAYMVAYMIRRSQKRNDGRPKLRGRLGKVVDVLYTFDADFSQAFVDGRIYEGLDHVDALERAACPLLLLHANWLRHPDYGLVGAMDDDDARYARELAPQMVYRRVDSDHVIHSENPELFAQEVELFLSGIK